MATKKILTRDEALATLSAWPPEVRETYDSYLSAYRRLRLQGGSDLYITRRMLAEIHGSNSIGMASKFMEVIEPLEGDQPRPRRSKGGAPNANSGSDKPQHPTAVQAAFEALQKAVETVSRAMMEARTTADREISERFQALLSDQQASFEAERLEDQVRIQDLEDAAAGAGEECCQSQMLVKELRAKLLA